MRAARQPAFRCAARIQRNAPAPSWAAGCRRRSASGCTCSIRSCAAGQGCVGFKELRVRLDVSCTAWVSLSTSRGCAAPRTGKRPETQAAGCNARQAGRYRHRRRPLPARWLARTSKHAAPGPCTHPVCTRLKYLGRRGRYFSCHQYTCAGGGAGGAEPERERGRAEGRKTVAPHMAQTTGLGWQAETEGNGHARNARGLPASLAPSAPLLQRARPPTSPNPPSCVRRRHGTRPPPRRPPAAAPPTPARAAGCAAAGREVGGSRGGEG